MAFKWLRDPRFNPPADESTSAPFLPVEVVATPPAIKAPAIDALIVEAPVIESGSSKSKVEIELPTGHRISVSGAYDPDALCRLVRGLAS